MEMYLTGSDICKEMQVSRTALLYARRRYKWPEPQRMGSLHVWERSVVTPFIDEWKKDRLAKQ